MIQRSYVGAAALVLLSACGGNRSTSTAPEPAPSAERAVQDFMRAVSDSNVARMAQLWGSAKGSAAETNEPADYPRRIVVIQAYLRGATYRILSNDQAMAQADRRLLQVELKREHCDKVVPFTVVRAGNAWIINQIDLGAAGSPGRPCESTGSASP